MSDKIIVGFGDIDDTGYLDRLFVHKDYQRQGIATVLCDKLDTGYEPAGPMFNIYHVSPHETQDPDEFVTEICYPVKKK